MGSPRWILAAAAALVVGVIATTGLAQQTDEITAEHTLNPDGTVRICFNLNDERFRGQIFDIDFYRPQPKFGDLVLPDWLPPSDTPPDRFRGPNEDWRFEPTSPPEAPAGWRALPPSPPVPGEGSYCLTIPHREKVPPGVAIQMFATDQRHLPLKNFTSTLKVAARPGDLPRQFALGGGAVAAVGAFTAYGRTCGLARVFEDQFMFTVSRGALTIRQPSTGDVVEGSASWNGIIRARSAGESYIGAIVDKGVIASYEYTTRDGCTASYEAQFALERAGRAVPACARPSVVAPATASVRADRRVPLRVGVTCAGSRVARWPMEIALTFAGRTHKLPTFQTRANLRNVVVNLGGTRPAALLVRVKPAFGLPGAMKRVRLIY